MGNVLTVVFRLLYLLLGGISAVLVWKNSEYFNALPENATAKNVLAWNTVMFLGMFVYFLVKLVMA